MDHVRVCEKQRTKGGDGHCWMGQAGFCGCKASGPGASRLIQGLALLSKGIIFSGYVV